MGKRWRILRVEDEVLMVFVLKCDSMSHDFLMFVLICFLPFIFLY